MREFDCTLHSESFRFLCPAEAHVGTEETDVGSVATVSSDGYATENGDRHVTIGMP